MSKSEKDVWRWYGVLIDVAGHIKLRQYWVVQDGQGRFRAEVRNKGETGFQWGTRRIGDFAFTHLEGAMAAVREEMDRWSAVGYTTVREGEPPRPDYEVPTGHREGDRWWADVLGVDPDADEATVKRQWIHLMRTYHPDANGPEACLEAARLVNEAWQHVAKANRWDKWRVS